MHARERSDRDHLPAVTTGRLIALSRTVELGEIVSATQVEPTRFGHEPHARVGEEEVWRDRFDPVASGRRTPGLEHRGSSGMAKRRGPEFFSRTRSAIDQPPGAIRARGLLFRTGPCRSNGVQAGTVSERSPITDGKSVGLDGCVGWCQEAV